MNKAAAVEKKRRMPAEGVRFRKALHRHVNKRAARSAVGMLFRLAFVVCICFIILKPLLAKIAMSFMQPTDLYDRTVKLIPKNFTFANYVDAVQIMDYLSVLGSTVFLCTLVALLQTVACTLIGYGFARFPFKGKGLLFLCVIVMMVIPTQIVVTPQFLNFKSCGLVGSIWPFVLLAVTGSAPRCGLYIFLTRQFFRGIPKEIDEAAAIDGAGPYRTFALIMVRSCFPIMVAVFLFSFVWQWGESNYTTLFDSSRRLLSSSLLQLGYSIGAGQSVGGTFVSAADINAYRSVIYAASTMLVIAPLLLLYVFLQRYFIQSIEQTGIVG